MVFSLMQPERLVVSDPWHLVGGEACGASRNCPSAPWPPLKEEGDERVWSPDHARGAQQALPHGSW